MNVNPTIYKAVETFDYRVTVGDVAAQTGLNVEQSRQDLLALASAAGGHLQVSEAGEIAYVFPKNFRGVIRNRSLRSQLKAWWDKVWSVLFYLIRISFGIILIASIVLVVLAIIVIVIAMQSQQRENNRSSSGGYSRGYGGLPIPRVWMSPTWYYVFLPNYYERRRRYYSMPQTRTGYSAPRQSESDMGFLEAVFSFLFGDGNPNANLEERRWQEVAAVIRNNKGAIAAAQVTPYLDQLGQGYDLEYENYMLPVLTRFNGKPEVSPDGNLIYYFPDLQVSAAQQGHTPVQAYLKEKPWVFSHASSTQLQWAAGLGIFNLAAIIVLDSLMNSGNLSTAVLSTGLVGFVNSIFWFLVAYGVGYLLVPILRYIWIKMRNQKIESRNEIRQERAIALQEADPAVLKTIDYAKQFAAETIVNAENLAYTTEKDLLQQNVENADKIDEEWRQRLEGR
ncbi:MAG: hypothetical protein ACTS2F_01005 [Thainema sp.]